MDLVHRERGLVDRAVAPVRHPVRVLPLVVRGGDDRRGRGRHLGAAGHRVGADRVRTVRAADVVLVQRALADPGQEQLPHPGRAQRTHRGARAVPVREVAGDPHTARVRRPHGEPGPGHALVDHRLRPERPPQLLVSALADQMQVQFADGGPEAVRVVDLDGVVLVPHLQPVLRDLRHGQHAGEEAVAVVVQLGPRPGRQHGDGAGVRAQRPHQHTARDRVRAQHVVRGVVVAGQQPAAVGGVEGGGRAGPLPLGGLPGARRHRLRPRGPGALGGRGLGGGRGGRGRRGRRRRGGRVGRGLGRGGGGRGGRRGGRLRWGLHGELDRDLGALAGCLAGRLAGGHGDCLLGG